MSFAAGLEPVRARLARAAQHDAFWYWLLPLALLVIELLGALGSAAYSYDHWDNFQYYTPMIAAAHGQLLRGELPLWNPHQHLGESFLANPQMGTFYPPYTLAYAAVTGLGLHWKWLCGLIFLTHLWLGAAGSFALLRQLGARRSLCFIGALGLCSAGYLRTGAAFWIFYAPTFGWLPWTLLGALRLLDGSRRLRDAALLVAGLTAQAYVGHPQILVYVWLTLGLFCAGYLLISELPARQRLGALGALALQGACALLLSLLTMWPLFVHSRNTVRKAPMTFEDFVRISVSPQGVLGMLLPGYRIRDGFIVRESVSFMLHQAAWVLPGLGLGVWLWLRAERLRQPTAERQLARRAAVLAATGGVLMVFAMGHYLKVYGWTYGIPVWSSFRYPHKFLCVALPCLGLAAALGLELLARHGESRAAAQGTAPRSDRRWRVCVAAASVLLALAIGLVLRWNGVIGRPVVALGLACGVLTLALTAFVHLPAVRAALAVCGIGSAASMVVLGQTFAPYLIDEPHAPPSARYAPSGEARILPVHVDRDRFDIYPRLLYQSATLLGVDSVTGLTTAMAPDWYLKYLPSNSRGLLPEQVYRELLPSHLLRSLNVRYVTAPLHDAQIERWLRRGGFQLDRTLEKVALYRTDSTLPRAYFASQVLPFSEAELRRGLLQNGADLRAAYVEADGPLPPGSREGQVLHADFTDPNRTRLQVDSPEGGLLVVSASYDPDWHARVDGNPTPVFRTNGLLQGLRVPAGRHEVLLSYESAALRQALWLAALGALGFVALALARQRGTRARAAVS